MSIRSRRANPSSFSCFRRLQADFLPSSLLPLLLTVESNTRRSRSLNLSIYILLPLSMKWYRLKKEIHSRFSFPSLIVRYCFQHQVSFPLFFPQPCEREATKRKGRPDRSNLQRRRRASRVWRAEARGRPRSWKVSSCLTPTPTMSISSSFNSEHTLAVPDLEKSLPPKEQGFKHLHRVVSRVLPLSPNRSSLTFLLPIRADLELYTFAVEPQDPTVRAHRERETLLDFLLLTLKQKHVKSRRASIPRIENEKPKENLTGRSASRKVIRRTPW